MDKKEVIEVIEYVKKYKTETNKIEVKAAFDGFPKCYDTFSSFSNKYGGIIIFGIDEENDFKIDNVYDINDLQKKISSMCSDSMEPAIRPDILPIEYEGKKLLAVKIEELNQNKKPCFYKPKGLKSGSYIRIGDSDQLMTDYEIYELQNYKEHIFEYTRPNRRATIEDLNKHELEKYIDRVKLIKPNFAKNSFEKCLKLSGIVDTIGDEYVPTMAGTLVFGEYPQVFYPQLFVACVVVPGIVLGETSFNDERFIDNKRVEGTIEEMLKETISFLVRNMKTSVIIDSNGNRKDKHEYPIKALREAIANALIHRDLSNQRETAYVSVYMYQDRVEIINPGSLYGNNKIEKLGTDTVMEVRNPTLVKLLEEKSDIIENRFSGILTMRREMKKYGLPEPEFYEDRGTFKVVFRNSSGQQAGQQSGQQDGQQNMILNYKLKILNYCKQAKTAKEIKEYLNIKSRQYVSTYLIKPLINEGKLGYTNKNSVNAKNQKYMTIDKNI